MATPNARLWNALVAGDAAAVAAALGDGADHWIALAPLGYEEAMRDPGVAWADEWEQDPSFDLLWTPIQHAAFHGQAEVIDVLLGAGADPSRVVRHYDKSALHLAAALGRDDIVATLIAANANVDAEDGNMATPIIYAAWNGHDAVARQLLEAGASPNAIDMRGNNRRTPLMWACAGGHVETVAALCDTYEGADRVDTEIQLERQTAMRLTLDGNNPDVLQVLVSDGGADLGGDGDNWTALTGAIGIGGAVGEAMVDVLLEAGADVNQMVYSTGQTPVHLACVGRRLRLLRSLLAAGADVELVDWSGDTPVDLAAGWEEGIAAIEAWRVAPWFVLISIVAGKSALL